MQNGLNDDADRDEVVEEEEEYFDDFDENGMQNSTFQGNADISLI